MHVEDPVKLTVRVVSAVNCSTVVTPVEYASGQYCMGVG